MAKPGDMRLKNGEAPENENHKGCRQDKGWKARLWSSRLSGKKGSPQEVSPWSNEEGKPEDKIQELGCWGATRPGNRSADRGAHPPVAPPREPRSRCTRPSRLPGNRRAAAPQAVPPAAFDLNFCLSTNPLLLSLGLFGLYVLVPKAKCFVHVLSVYLILQ